MIRLGMKLHLLTMVRKSELQDAVWDEIDFDNAIRTIPKDRMKRSKSHNVYLYRQMSDIMIALETCAGNSRYLLPSRYDADAPMVRATLNHITYAVVEQAKKEGLPLEPFRQGGLKRCIALPVDRPCAAGGYGPTEAPGPWHSPDECRARTDWTASPHRSATGLPARGLRAAGPGGLQTGIRGRNRPRST